MLKDTQLVGGRVGFKLKFISLHLVLVAPEKATYQNCLNPLTLHLVSLLRPQLIVAPGSVLSLSDGTVSLSQCSALQCLV